MSVVIASVHSAEELVSILFRNAQMEHVGSMRFSTTPTSTPHSSLNHRQGLQHSPVCAVCVRVELVFFNCMLYLQ